MTAPLWTAAKAAAALNIDARGDWTATGVAIDSRSLAHGDLFVAIVGDRLDGHAYVADALANGAAAALVHRTPEGVDADDPRLLHVADSLKGLETLAAAARTRTDAKVVAVTGSVGKTGTKEMLARAFAASGPTHVSQGNLNNHWGAPLSLARMPAATGFAVIELGMNHAGEIRPLTKMTRPNAAIVTRIAPAHTAFFDSIEAVADAKAEIFEGLEPGGVAILNADDPLTPRLAAAARAAGAVDIVTFGEAADADVRLTRLDLDPDGSTVAADAMGHAVEWRLGAPGRHWAQNSLAVAAALPVLGGDLEAGLATLADMRPPSGRGERRRIQLAGGGFDLVDESYNASPAAVVAAFQTLALTAPDAGGERVVVLGDMLELGERSADDHAALGKAFVAAGLDRAHAAGPECRHFLDALPAAARGLWSEDAGGLARRAAEIAHAGDVVLVKGSLGMGMARVVTALEALAASGDRGAAHAV